LATRASEARSSEAHARAEANFKKEERAKDGAKAMMEYQAEGKAIRDKMAKLKALRLAKEMRPPPRQLPPSRSRSKPPLLNPPPPNRPPPNRLSPRQLNANR
jgi:hypothetical protein